MYKTPVFSNGSITINTSSKGETIEQKIARLTLGGDIELIEAEKTIIHGTYSEDYDIRRDNQERFLDQEAAGQDAIYAKRKEALEELNKEENGGGEEDTHDIVKNTE